MLLDRLKDAKDSVNDIENQIFHALNKGSWVVSVHDHMEPIEFSVWAEKDNIKIIDSERATLSESEILSVGKYTEEQLKPALEQIKLLSGDK